MPFRTGAGARFAQLALLGECVFHADDAANLWGIGNENTLHTTLSRYVRAGLLYRVRHGLYATKLLAALDPNLVGVKAIHGPAYVSCETVLFREGYLNQPSREITLVARVAKRFTIGTNQYRCRQLAPRYLMNDVGVETVHGVRIATLPRAIADMRYFYPKKYLDKTVPRAVESASLDIARVIGYTTS